MEMDPLSELPGFFNKDQELVFICLRCAGHIPTGVKISDERSGAQQHIDRHVCLSEPSVQGLQNLEELGFIDEVAKILGIGPEFLDRDPT